MTKARLAYMRLLDVAGRVACMSFKARNLDFDHHSLLMRSYAVEGFGEAYLPKISMFWWYVPAKPAHTTRKG